MNPQRPQDALRLVPFIGQQEQLVGTVELVEPEPRASLLLGFKRLKVGGIHRLGDQHIADELNRQIGIIQRRLADPRPVFDLAGDGAELRLRPAAGLSYRLSSTRMEILMRNSSYGDLPQL